MAWQRFMARPMMVIAGQAQSKVDTDVFRSVGNKWKVKPSPIPRDQHARVECSDGLIELTQNVGFLAIEDHAPIARPVTTRSTATRSTTACSTTTEGNRHDRRKLGIETTARGVGLYVETVDPIESRGSGEEVDSANLAAPPDSVVLRTSGGDPHFATMVVRSAPSP